MTELSLHLSDNIAHARNLFPIAKSFDIIARDLCFGGTRGYWIGINGMCQADILQKIFADLQNSLPTDDFVSAQDCVFSESNVSAQGDAPRRDPIFADEIQKYMASRISCVQSALAGDWEQIVHGVLSGQSVLFIDGFDRAILLDTRSYPARDVKEPDTEQVTSGARDGFVETLLVNANLIRRRLRTAGLTFESLSIGAIGRTDVAIAYIDGIVDQELLSQLRKRLLQLNVTTLTLGAKSLEELLVPKKWYHPLPSFHLTQRPDTACSYLAEGHIAVIVDNSPSVIILPASIFHFTQSPEDYYKSPVVGAYFRGVRFLCIPVNLLLMPVFVLITVYYPALSEKLSLISTQKLPGAVTVLYVVIVEFLLDLFKYSTSLNSGRFSGSLSIIGGLIIGDVAVDLHWASVEILFYAAITLLTSLSLASIEFSDALRVYRMFLIFTTAAGGLPGFLVGLSLTVVSVLTTPTFAGKSYLWPLWPFNWQALKMLLFRYPAFRAQPSKVWRR